MSLNMLIEFGDAFDFTGSDFAGWCKEAGFKEIDVVPLAGPTSAAHRVQVARHHAPLLSLSLKAGVSGHATVSRARSTIRGW